MKLCKDCAYCFDGRGSYGARCNYRRANTGHPDYVYGGLRDEQRMMEPPLAQKCRESEDACGPDAKWFEPKERAEK